MKFKYRLAVVVTALSGLFACGSAEDLETANFGSDAMVSRYTFVNLTDTQVNFHMRNSQLDGDARNASGDKYRRASVTSKQDVPNVPHELNAGLKMSIYATAPDEVNNNNTLHASYKPKKYYNVYAWNDNNRLRLSALDRSSSDVANTMAVRFFATEDLVVNVGNTRVQMRAGQQSNFYRLDNCAGDMSLGDIAFDACDGNYGSSYVIALSRDEVLGMYLQR